MVVKYYVLEHYTIRKMTMNNHFNDLTSSYHHDLTKVLKRKRRQKQWMTIVMIMLMIYFYIRTLIAKVSPLMRSEPNDPSLLLPTLKFDLPIQSYRNQTYELHVNDKMSERYNVDDPRIKYDMNFISTYQSPVRMYGSHRVEDSLKKLPLWLQNYFKWHSKQRQNPSSNETKYLVITCFRGDDYCGGTSDRLRPLPYYLLVANATQRVLLIKWTKPFDLGEFLMPARDIDWRTPLEGFDDLIEESNGKNGICQSKIKGFFGGLCSAFVEDRTGIESCHNFIVDRLRREDDTFLIFDLVRKSHEQINQCNMLFQKFSYEEEFPALNKWDFPEMFGYIFRVMFQPTPVIGNNIQTSMEKMNINDGEYISVHVRSKYPSDRILQKNDHTHVDKSGGLSFNGEIRDHLIDVADNAIRCAQKLSPTLPLYFASDSHSLTKLVLNENKYSSKIVGIDRLEEPFHIDGDYNDVKPSDFYSGFEDLLIFGGSKCVSHGMGSFGSFGAGLIGNSCKVVHRKFNGMPIECNHYDKKTQMVSIITNIDTFSRKRNTSIPEINERYDKREQLRKNGKFRSDNCVYV